MSVTCCLLAPALLWGALEAYVFGKPEVHVSSCGMLLLLLVTVVTADMLVHW
jgi:hypothetical protein